MDAKSQNRIDFLASSHTFARRFSALIPILALVIVLIVFWWLKLIGLTMAGDAFCGFEEHEHTEECVQSTLICTLDEDSEHTHTDECYEITYICGKEEHIHTSSCYSDIKADLETQSDWEATIADVDLNHSAAQNIVNIAQTQIGYRESEKNFEVGTDGIRRGYTRYGEWYGNPYGDWSSMFAAFCLEYAGLNRLPVNSGVEAMRLEWEKAGLYFDFDISSVKKGDIIFIDDNLNGKASHCAVIKKISDGKISAIQGDCDGEVKEVSFNTTDEKLTGYGSLDKAIVYSASETDKKRIENVNSLIASLPTPEDVSKKLDEYESANDTKGYAEYFNTTGLNVKTVYAYYEDLGPMYYDIIPDTEKLDNLEWLWSADTLADETEITVYQVNKYSKAVTTLVYGGSVRSVLGTGMSYTYWDAYVIEDDGNGNLYVAKVTTADVSKLDYKASTSNGFVLLVYDNSLANAGISVGDKVSIGDFYKTTSGYNASGLGKIVFNEEAVTKPEKDNSNKLNIVESADTKDFIEVNLYQYSSNINDLYLSSNHKYPGFQQAGGTKSIGSTLSSYSMNFGDNITADIATVISTVTTNNPGAINATTNHANRPISGAMNDSLIDGYPALADGTSLKYLYSQNEYADKVNSQSINGLFQYNDETGEYYFNCRDNHAQYNPEDDTFTLYEQKISSNFIMYPFGNFLPFNDIVKTSSQTTEIDRDWFLEIANTALYKYNSGMGSEYQTLYNVLTKFISIMDSEYGQNGWNYRTALEKYFALNGLTFPQDDDYLSEIYSIDYDEPTNFFFGMNMHMEFIQPKDGLTGLDGKQEMIYEFTGDDDVWIYIDGKLFLDLSGIHRHVGGQIDFVNGKVYYYELDTSTGDVSTEPYKTVTFAEILGTTDGLNEKGTFENYSTHKLDFYYNERGAGSGVCRMNFNLPLIEKNNISVNKDLTSDDDISVLGNPDFKFQVYKENGSDLFIGANTEYTIYDKNGNILGTGLTDSNGIFTIKAGQLAVFGNIPENSGKYFVRELLDTKIFDQYGDITVDGSSVTTDKTNVVIGNDVFNGLDSPIKDVSDGSTTFKFNNVVDIRKYGSLEIEKEAHEYSSNANSKSYIFSLNFDGNGIPVGTEYTVIHSDGTQTVSKVTETGQVELKSGDRIKIDRILAGSSFTLQEINSSAYNVTYTAESGEITHISENGSEYVKGTIEYENAVSIHVLNDKNGTKLKIPAQKTLLRPDGNEYTFNFTLQQIISQSDTSPVENGLTLVTSSTLSSGSDEFEFTLNYPPGTEAGKYYYLISENDCGTTAISDKSQYIVEVTVTSSGGTVSAEVTGIFKDNSQQDDILFINNVSRSLTISKSVEGVDDTTTSFAFDIYIEVDGKPLEGTFECTGTETKTITFTNGKAIVYLKHGENLTIVNLPYGAVWSVTEQKTNGFSVKCALNDEKVEPGNAVGGTLNENSKAVFVNIGGFELPETGNNGTIYWTLGGLFIISGALLCGIHIKKTKKRKAS